MYFVRRGGRVKGPLARERLRELRNADRLRMRDEIAMSADGPWERLRDVHDDVLGAEETAAVEDEFWREELPPEKPKAAAPAEDAAARPWSDRLRELIEGDGAFRKPFHAGSFLAAAVPLLALAAFVAVILVSPALEPVRQPPRPVAAQPVPLDPVAAMPQTAPAVPDLAAEADAEADAPGKISVATPDHETAITALLTAYYAASDWQARYRLVVPGEQTRRLLQQLQEGRPPAAGRRWSRLRPLEADKLAVAARSGQPVLVETSVDEHVHALYVVFVAGRWRVDWARSLESLWLTR